MRKKIHVSIIYNEPVMTSGDLVNYISEMGVLGSVDHKGRAQSAVMVDLSEVGILEEKEDISKALQALGYKTSIFNVDGDLCRLVNFLKNEKPDLVFNCCESVGNESIHEMHIAGVFELMGVCYTGSSPLVLGMSLNKVRVKEMLEYYGLPTPRFQLIKSPVKIALADYLDFPLFVKPACEDASVGIDASSVVTTLSELRKKVRQIVEKYAQPALVEEYIDGRELNVAIMGNRRPVTLPISEIDMSTLPKQYPRILSYNAKWLRGTEEYEHTKGVCPALLPPELESRIKELALSAYRLIGCRDYARVDFRLNKEYEPYILEVNPNPDISDDAGFARSARASGMTFDTFVGRIVEYALERPN